MERGPLALFGAIIAVGLGPALWMGVQLGSMPTRPGQPPAVVTDQQKVTNDQLVGGTGAGEETSDSDDSPVDTAPQGNVLPLNTSPTAEPTPTATTPEPSPTVTTPSESASPAPTTDAPTTPPVEATTPAETEPTDIPPTDETTPPVEDDTDDPSWPPYPDEDADDGDGGAGWDGVGKGDRADSWASVSPSE
ncbi:hypothetical protein ACQP2X_06540 [Actinoplanes sp. CA-131856]